jgi:cytosine/adenosine deaminase-related metal-dependent hydrolase
MALVISGRLVPISLDRRVAPRESASFKGRLWIADDGTITAVTKGSARRPDGFASAPVVDVGDDLVLPGFIDLHSHLAYAALPLWSEPGRTTPFLHHNTWPTRPTYAACITWPAYAYVVAAPAELLAYAEVRALLGGTTSIQGSPPSNRPLDGWLVRNVEDERLGGTLSAERVLASTLTLKPEQLGRRATQMRAGCCFIYHCAEGQADTIVTREYGDLQRAGCLQGGLVAIHACALRADAFDAWGQPGSIVWSPFSNLWLYGETTDIPGALARGIKVCIGSDWGPSGTRNVQGELKVAALVAQARNWDLTPFDLVKMITAHPGDTLSAAWGRQVGRLQPGALADVVVLSSAGRADPFRTVLRATEQDVRLVVIHGRPVYGTPPLMTAARAQNTSDFKLGSQKRRLSMTRFEDRARTWPVSAVLDRMEAVRADPKGQIESARQTAYAGALRGDPPSLRLALDMPTGIVPIGGLPKDLGQIVVPPIPPMEHDEAFFAEIARAGFHDGLLDGLSTFYD